MVKLRRTRTCFIAFLRDLINGTGRAFVRRNRNAIVGGLRLAPDVSGAKIQLTLMGAANGSAEGEPLVWPVGGCVGEFQGMVIGAEFSDPSVL